MILSTTTRILREKTLENLQKELEALSESKFNHINLGFTEFQTLLDRDINLKPIADRCRQLNLKSTTSHAPIHWTFFFNEYYNREDREILENRIIKSIKMSKFFDVQWIVIHIGTYLDRDGKYDIEKSIEYNKKYLERFVNCANEVGIKIAIENGTQLEEDTTPYPEELIKLVDYFNNKYEKEVLGICFDFGHANVGKLNIYEEIKKIGKRLKVTHIHDNYGNDDHNFCYTGTINWNLAMKALKEINYHGELNLEVRYNSNLKELENKETIPVDLINSTYSLLERLEKLINNPEDTDINVIIPKEDNIEYTTRKAVYAIIKKDDKIIIAKEGGDYFLIGGGIEQGESELEALERELIEETGYTIKNLEYFDKVKSYEYNKKYGNLEITATIYIAEFEKKVANKIEKNSIIECSAEEYQDKLEQEYQRYILRKFINSSL